MVFFFTTTLLPREADWRAASRLSSPKTAPFAAVARCRGYACTSGYEKVLIRPLYFAGRLFSTMWPIIKIDWWYIRK